MNIFSFTARFGTEEDCRNHFKVQRDKNGTKQVVPKKDFLPKKPNEVVRRSQSVPLEKSKNR